MHNNKTFETLLVALKNIGGEKAVFDNKDVAHLVASGHKILSMRDVEGLEVQAKETIHGISAKVIVKEGVRIKHPVHLCFGILHKKGTQKIKMDVKLQKDASAHFIAHCIFPKAEKVKHIMDAIVEIGENSEMRYSETHYHGPYGGIKVVPMPLHP